MKCLRVIIKDVEDCTREQFRISNNLRVNGSEKKLIIPASISVKHWLRAL